MTGDVAATTWTHQPAVSAMKAAGAAAGWRRATLRAKARARIDPAHDSALRRGPYGECARPDGHSAAVASAIVTSATARAGPGRRPARREAARATRTDRTRTAATAAMSFQDRAMGVESKR